MERVLRVGGPAKPSVLTEWDLIEWRDEKMLLLEEIQPTTWDVQNHWKSIVTKLFLLTGAGFLSSIVSVSFCASLLTVEN